MDTRDEHGRPRFCECEQVDHFNDGDGRAAHAFGLVLPNLVERRTPFGTFRLCRPCHEAGHMGANPPLDALCSGPGPCVARGALWHYCYDHGPESGGSRERAPWDGRLAPDGTLDRLRAQVRRGR